MNIIFFNRYTVSGASSRLRVLQYFPHYESLNINVRESALFDEGYLSELYTSNRRSRMRVAKLYCMRIIHLLSVWKYDLVWIEKELFPYLPAVVERLFRVFGVRYVVEYDDAIFHNYDESSSRYIKQLLSKKIDVVMRNSCCVVAGNRYIANRAMQAGAAKVVVVPTVIDSSRYHVAERTGGGPLVIGWIGTPSTQQYVIDIWPSLLKAYKQYGAKIVLVGADPRIVEFLPGGEVEILTWCEDTEVSLINLFDIGIMPLRDGPWERGKCGYKLIQYMGCGVPVIASPVGVNVDIVGESGCGLLAASLSEWDSAILELSRSSCVRRSMGMAGRQAVEQKYSISVQVHVLTSIMSAATEIHENLA